MSETPSNTVGRAVKKNIEATTTEQKFIELRESTSAKDWDSIPYLEKLAASFVEKDKALSDRILVRVNNLNKAKEREGKKEQELKREREKEEKKESGKERAIETDLALAETRSNRSKISQLKAKAKEKGKKQLKTSLFWFVVIPVLIFSFYQIVIASERYQSSAKIIVQQPDGMATMDASMALLSGFGVSVPGASDAELVKAYIYSKDMLDYLVSELNIAEHFTSSHVDIVSRLASDFSQEDLYAFYRDRVNVEIDEKSMVIAVVAQGFTPEYAQRLTQTISQRAEWYINKIGNDLAESQLAFIRGEHVMVEEKLLSAKQQLLGFQDKYNLLDPEAEGLAIQQIAYTLEAQLAERQSALNALTAVMSDTAPQVVSLKNEIQAIEKQLLKERSRLSNNNSLLSGPSSPLGNTEISVGAILAKYTELKIGLELALQAFTSSQISLEKARIEAYRKLKYLVVVETPTLPEDNEFPKVTYNITLFTLLLLMLFGIGRLVLATIHELK
ncbi:lipopolysaccharide biosynthesis protein [Enterovibrio norvegicus]|uniref:Lipopolysaccharide biosynthesis protein n=1 Tax=Enterovibrio norvegicus TaxID=188144 RepID=A0ABV4L8G0_9GAMM|nr:lipopolysaccharide biosynthesis protein [Enterovibrio norvegicus]MCC4801054.1 lipopolysaccharide biosynthesis protein [Enterovibrio norvegicus]TKF10793.1 lipopolysaccharide biosynthesis protein [Enterovibrio norvegicus]